MEWKDSIVIKANIDKVWRILNDETYLKEIKPQVVQSILIPEKSQGNIKVYNEMYQEGKRQESYELTLITEENIEELKKQSFNFIIANTIESTGYFSLKKGDEKTTIFTYSGLNKGVNFIGKILLKISKKSRNDNIVTDFLNKVKEVAERKI
ncbi:hypothetical protein [Lactococcus garvieae]